VGKNGVDRPAPSPLAERTGAARTGKFGNLPYEWASRQGVHVLLHASLVCRSGV